MAFGSYSKLQAVKYFLPHLYSYSEERIRNEGIYLGDSLNDEEMFSFMPFSIGMHSVEDLRQSFTNLPRYITRSYSGEGFSEVVKALLD